MYQYVNACLQTIRCDSMNVSKGLSRVWLHQLQLEKSPITLFDKLWLIHKTTFCNICNTLFLGGLDISI